MLNIALYGSDPLFLSEFSREIASQLGGGSKEACRFRQFSPFQTTLYREDQPPFDLCVVDIRNDPQRELAFAIELNQTASAEVMVVAPSAEWAMSAYDGDIMSYLLYPPDPQRAARLILRRFFRKLEAEESQFSFKTPSGVRVLGAQRIVYIEYSDHRMLVHTDFGGRLVTNSMRVSFGKAAGRILEDPRFVRTHASFIVNILHISEFGQEVLQMDTGVSVPISHAKRKEVKQQFNRFFSQASPKQDAPPGQKFEKDSA